MTDNETCQFWSFPFKDIVIIRQALAYVSEERLVDLCNGLDLTLTEADELRNHCQVLLDAIETDLL